MVICYPTSSNYCLCTTWGNMNHGNCVDGLFGDIGLASIDNVIAFYVTSLKLLDHCCTDDIKSYVSNRIILLLRLNVTAGRTTTYCSEQFVD